MIKCPICSNSLKISRLECGACQTHYTGSFELPRLARLDKEWMLLAENFILHNGNLKDLAQTEKTSYPTLRKRLDQLIEQLQALRTADDKKTDDILSAIENGEMTGEEGVRRIREIKGEL